MRSLANILFKVVLVMPAFVVFTSGQTPKWIVLHPENSELPSKVVRKCITGSNKTMWLAVGNDGLAKYDGSSWNIYNTGNSGIPGMV